MQTQNFTIFGFAGANTTLREDAIFRPGFAKTQNVISDSTGAKTSMQRDGIYLTRFICKMQRQNLTTFSDLLAPTLPCGGTQFSDPDSQRHKMSFLTPLTTTLPCTETEFIRPVLSAKNKRRICQLFRTCWRQHYPARGRNFWTQTYEETKCHF